MNYKQAEEYIHSFTRFGSQLGLERMRRLLFLMGNPHDELKFVHVAGTNGKGSTVKMSETVLRKAGYRVGMYISPFVVDFRERFQINGEMITKSEFARLTAKLVPLVKKMAENGQQVTEFEVITAIAFEYFRRNHCDIVCLEVGLGGKYDATNVIKTPEVAIIASISLDHTEILGDTIKEIAGEKAGIIKKNTDVVTYPLQEAEAVAVFMEQCAKTHSRLTLPNANAVKIVSETVLGSGFIYDHIKYSLRLAGNHQIYNAVAVIEAMKLLRGKGYHITDDDIKHGLRHAVFPARFEIMSKAPLIIVDGTHNKQAAQALAQTLKMLDASPKIAVMGMMADKDYDAALSFVLSECSGLIAIPVANNQRAADPELLAETAKKYCENVSVQADYRKALEEAVSLSGENGAVIVCGSFYMASDMRKTIKEYKKDILT